MHIILDSFNSERINVVCDEAGITLRFNSKQDAEEYGKENLQILYWQVVEIKQPKQKGNHDNAKH